MKIASSDLKRFSKQIILKNIGVAGQKKIFSSKVLIVGVGGLGCPLILYLANSGVGKIGIVDYDRVDITNLKSIEKLYNFISDKYGKLDVLINSGTSNKKNDLDSISFDDWFIFSIYRYVSLYYDFCSVNFFRS